MVVDGNYEREVWYLINQLHVQGKCGILATRVVPHAKAWSEVILQTLRVRYVLAEWQAEAMLRRAWAT